MHVTLFNHLRRTTVCVVTVIAITLGTAVQVLVAGTVHELRQAGWIIVEKTEQDVWRPGLPPYENLRRLIYEVTYTLQKEGLTMTCILTRDVMFDTSRHTCTQAK